MIAHPLVGTESCAHRNAHPPRCLAAMPKNHRKKVPQKIKPKDKVAVDYLARTETCPVPVPCTSEAASSSLARIAAPIAGQHPPPELDSFPNPPAPSISTFEGAKDFTVSNSIINTVAGNFNQPIFKFDGSECSCYLNNR
jgi:hypothetical protein